MAKQEASSLEAELDAVQAHIDRLEEYKQALTNAIRIRFQIALPAGESGALSINTLAMARVVLENLHGEEKKPEDIRRLIHTTYGVEPVKSLEQMLYRQAQRGSVFYKTGDGRFGLTSFRVQTETVRLPSTGLA